MVEDVTNIQLSQHASDVANQLKESGAFDSALSAALFGMAYAIKYYRNEIDPENLLNTYDSTGNNYNVGSVDGDNIIVPLINALYPNCSTPYRYARVFMCYGLNKLGDLLNDGRLFPLANIM